MKKQQLSLNVINLRLHRTTRSCNLFHLREHPLFGPDTSKSIGDNGGGMSRHGANGFSTADKSDDEATQQDYQLTLVKDRIYTRERNITMKSSTKDQVKGKFHEVKGKVKEIAGKLSGKSKLEAEGKDEKIAGAVQDKIGQVKKVVGK